MKEKNINVERITKYQIEIIQVLRGIAAIGIVYFHTEYGLWKSANWGVDLFFVLSGFLMMISTENMLIRKEWKKYWINKVIKICPLYYFTTLIVVIVNYIMPTVFRTTIVSVESILKSFLFIPCYAQNNKICPIYSVGWTINLEMFFYLIFFLAILVNHKHRGEIAIVIISTLIMLGIIIQTQNAIFRFWTSIRMFDYLLGILSYFIIKKVNLVRINKRILLSLIVILIISLFLGIYILKDNFSFIWNGILCSILLIEPNHACCVIALSNFSAVPLFWYRFSFTIISS